MAKSIFHKDFQPRHQKGRRIPSNLQDKVNTELKKLLDEKHKIKLSSCPDKNFISPIVTTVKKVQTIKLALESLKLIKLISASVTSINLKFKEYPTDLHNLMQVPDPAHQIRPKTEFSYKTINLISTLATTVYKQDYYLPPHREINIQIQAVI